MNNNQSLIMSINDVSAFSTAVKFLHQDQPIIIPTDTVYGVAGRVFSELAVKRVMELKERDFAKPLPVFIHNMDLLKRIAVELPQSTFDLIDKFWPGALTIVVKKNPDIASLAFSGRDTIALRMPAYPFILELLQHVGEPITATSANLSGSPTLSTATELADHFTGKKIPLILDGGRSFDSLPSTIIDLTVEPAVIIREGAISVAEIKKALPKLWT